MLFMLSEGFVGFFSTVQSQDQTVLNDINNTNVAYQI